MTEILQKNGPEYKKYTIKDTGVYLEVKTNDNFTGKLVKFEHIGFEEILVKHKPSAYVTGLFVSVMFNVLFFILFIIDSVQEAGIDPNILFGAVIGALIPLGMWGRSVFKNEKEKILKG